MKAARILLFVTFTAILGALAVGKAGFVFGILASGSVAIWIEMRRVQRKRVAMSILDNPPSLPPPILGSEHYGLPSRPSDTHTGLPQSPSVGIDEASEYEDSPAVFSGDCPESWNALSARQISGLTGESTFETLPRVVQPQLVRKSKVRDVISAIRPPKVKKLEWVPVGVPVQISGRTIPGMIYLSDGTLGWGGEPSAICKSMRVDGWGDDLEDLSYYPSYDSLSPSQRGFYLDWLARGRRDLNPDDLPTGYLFLFFYGIERRVLVDGDADPALWFEVMELLKAYGLTRKSWSIASYLGDFLHFSSYVSGISGYSNVCQMLFELQGRRMSETALTLALANHFRSGESIGWSLAHIVAMNLEDSRRSVVTERAGEEFKSMFRKRFEDLYPDGMALKASKRDATVRYQTGNATLSPRFSGYSSGGGGSDTGTLIKVPGVMGRKSQFKNLAAIWNQCIEDLSGYSRAIAKFSAATSVSNQDHLKAYLALPIEIRRERQHPLAGAFAEALESCPEINGIRFLPVGVVAGMQGIDERVNLTQKQSEDVAVLVESLGYTMAPHPVILNLPLSWTQEVAVAACPDAMVAPKELGGLLRLFYLAVLVASADGVVDETEMGVFHRASGISDGFGRIQIQATEAALIRDTHAASKHLQRIAKSVHQSERMTVFKLLVHIACSDEVLSSDENRLLRRISKAFQLGEDALDDLLTEDSSFHTVTVTRGRARSGGEAIPHPAETVGPAFSLDMERIAALTAETAEVVSILSKALAEEAHEESVVEVTEAVETSMVKVDWAESLEARYQPALLEILMPTNGKVLDLDSIADRHHLMTDDLVDGINAWSDEVLGDFLIEIPDNGPVFLRHDLIPNN